MKLILASQSPRRRELLGTITDDFTIAPVRDVEEVYPRTLPAEEVPAYLSRLKAQAYSDLIADGQTVVLTADTVVILDGEILGKPHDRRQAIEMLSALAGRTHKVVTGVTLSGADGKTDTFNTVTEVTFGPLDMSDIEYYVDTYKPFDKAGAYGIQEWIGAAAVEKINGSYYNVVGLPLHAIFKHLRRFTAQR